MLNYDVVIEREKLPLRIKRKFVEGIKNRDFIINLALILFKSTLFIFLISDDKANGVNLKLVFYSMPPVLVWITILAAYLSFGFYFKGRMQKWTFWSLNLLFTILCIGDMWYFRSNSVFLNYHMFGMASNLENLGSSIISMSRAIDLVFILDLIYLSFRYIKDRKTFKEYSRNVVGGLVIMFLCLSYLLYVNIKVDKLGHGFENQLLFRGSWSPNQTMSNLTPIGYHIFDGFSFIKETKPYVFDDSEKAETENTLKSIKENYETTNYNGLLSGKNLVIIQWESLETFIVGQQVNGQEVTPNLNKMLKNAFYFDNFHEQTWGGTSSDAELITNTSVFPVRDGTTFFRYPNNNYKYSLPNIFENMGYNTIASHPDKGSYWNWMANQKSIGYNTLLDSTDYDTSDKINLGVSDKSYLRQFTEVIKKEEAPFLAYTITLTSHTPFLMPENEQYLTLPDNLKDTKLGGYYQSIHYTDKYIGEMLNDLEESGMKDDTVFVIYGDHEGVHKFYDDEIEAMSGLEPWMKENNKKVPFVIYNPSIEGETLSKLSGQVDILPTLGNLFGVAKEEYTTLLTLGRDLLNTKESYVLLSNRTLLEEGLSEEKKEAIKKLTDISDKMIRGNYYREGSVFDER